MQLPRPVHSFVSGTLPISIRRTVPALPKSIVAQEIESLRAMGVEIICNFVVGLTRTMALDHVKDGIRVNCVCPGTTETPWIGERLQEAPDPQAAMATLVARQPMGRLGRAEEMAAAYLFLASDESAFTTGTALIVDGGFTA